MNRRRRGTDGIHRDRTTNRHQQILDDIHLALPNGRLVPISETHLRNSRRLDPNQRVAVKLGVRVIYLTVPWLTGSAEHLGAAWPHASDVITGLQRSASASFEILHDEHTLIRSF